MLRVLLVLTVAFGTGTLLALDLPLLPLRPGLTGLALMLLAAVAIRHYWLGRALAAPGSPERTLWLSFASTALIAGHLFTSLWQIGPAMTRHSLATHALGIDNWTLIFGALIAWAIARDPDPRRDERDAQIGGRALKVTYWALVLQLLVLILTLGFAPQAAMARLSHLMLAHLLIATLVIATLVHDAVCLRAYGLDRRAERDADRAAAAATGAGGGR